MKKHFYYVALYDYESYTWIECYADSEIEHDETGKQKPPRLDVDEVKKKINHDRDSVKLFHCDYLGAMTQEEFERSGE